MIHTVKCDSDFFHALKCGDKTFELRRNDRDYRVGDYLAVNEVTEVRDEEMSLYLKVPAVYKKVFSGDSLLFRITYVLEDAELLAPSMVALGLKKVSLPCESVEQSYARMRCTEGYGVHSKEMLDKSEAESAEIENDNLT